MNRLPIWFKQDLPDTAVLYSRLEMLGDLNTVCKSAHCPNMGSCFKNGQATFMILGDICTRNCRFCAVKKGNPSAVNVSEPENLARAVKEMGLDYVVITSVSRDDLKDKGTNQFVRCVEQLRCQNKNIRIELLIPDFQGRQESLEIVVNSKPNVIGHNLETVARLYREVRPLADYELSLKALAQIKEIDKSIITKSGIMVGLGENFEEVVSLMKDLRSVSCDILTIGQYLAPSEEHLKVEKFLSEEEFEEFKVIGQSLGFKCVFSAPLVRSSYQASQIFEKCLTQ